MPIGRRVKQSVVGAGSLRDRASVRALPAFVCRAASAVVGGVDALSPEPRDGRGEAAGDKERGQTLRQARRATWFSGGGQRPISA